MNKFIFIILVCLTTSCAPMLIGTGAVTGARIAQQDRTLGDALDDVSIWTRVNNKLFNYSVDKLFATVSIKVNEGRVLLTGHVEDPVMKEKASDLAWEVHGVKEVINEIHVYKPGEYKVDIKDYSKDTWVTTKIKSKLLLEKNIKSANYNIKTVNGIVYIFGIAQNQEEIDKIITIIRNIKYVKEIVSHVKIKDELSRNIKHRF